MMEEVSLETKTYQALFLWHNKIILLLNDKNNILVNRSAFALQLIVWNNIAMGYQTLIPEFYEN